MRNDDIVELDNGISPVEDFNTTYNNETSNSIYEQNNKIDLQNLPTQNFVYELQPEEEPHMEIINNDNVITIDPEHERIENAIAAFETPATEEQIKAFTEEIEKRANRRRKREKFKVIKTAILTGVLSIGITVGAAKVAEAKSIPQEEPTPHFSTVQEVTAAANASRELMEQKSDAILDAYVEDVMFKMKDTTGGEYGAASYFNDKFNQLYYDYISKKIAYDEAVAVIEEPEVIEKSSKIKDMHNKYRNSAYRINTMCFDLSLHKYSFDRSIYKDAITTDNNPGVIYIPLDTLVQKGLIDGDYSLSSLPEGSTVIDGRVYIAENNISKEVSKQL